jgi:hypothetical protein
MNEEQLRGWMRVLPRAKASPAFTSDVMRRIRQERGSGERPRPLVWRLSAGFAMAACLAVLVHSAITLHAQRQHIAAIRAEKEQLAADLEAVKKIARESEPVLVLEDGRGTRVIMDLDSAIQPVSNRTFD